MPDPPYSKHKVEMGARLRGLREVLDLTQPAMGKVMGVGASTVASWESGRNLIDLSALSRASRHIGFTTDWIALGDYAGVRFDLAIKLQAHFRNQTGSEEPRPRGRPRKKKFEKQSAIPTVRDVPDATHKAPKALQEPQENYLAPPKLHVA